MAPRAIAYARTLLDRPQMAEDVVQDVLCRLLRHAEYDVLRDGERLLFRSVTNACINVETRRKQVLSLDEGRLGELNLLETLESASCCDPAEAAASQEVLDAVEQELRRLPALQRAAVELKAMGEPLKTIAAVIGVSVSNAGVLVHRGRQTLRERLGPKLPGEFR